MFCQMSFYNKVTHQCLLSDKKGYMSYVIDETKTGVFLLHSVILPVVLAASNTVCQYRNVDVLVVERITTSLQHQHASVFVLRQPTGEHRRQCFISVLFYMCEPLYSIC